MRCVWLVVGLVACANAAPKPTTQVTIAESRAKPPVDDCHPACAHAVDLELDVIRKGYADAATRIVPARDRYVADCAKHCADIDVACATSASSVIDLAKCAPPKKPAYFMSALDDVYPYDEYARAPRQRVDVSLYGFARPLSVELPRGMRRSAEVMAQWEAPGAWMSPLSFRFERASDITSNAVFRERYVSDRELDEVAQGTRFCISSAREDERQVYVACFLPFESKPDTGVVCRGFATKGSGWPSLAEVAGFLRSVCGSVEVP
jgi:hypothetical protein